MPKIMLYKHKTPIDVRYMDIDALNHVNNARYLNYLEESRLSYCRDVFMFDNNLKKLGFVVANINIDFKLPIRFGDSITIYTRVTKIGSKSVVFDSSICIEKEGMSTEAAFAKQVLVTIDTTTQKSIAITPELKKCVEYFEKEQY